MTDENSRTNGDGATAPPKIPGSSGASALPKRFYKLVTVARCLTSGRTPLAPASQRCLTKGQTPPPWRIHLDGRPARTPAKRFVELPTRALAEAVAAEWEAQSERIDPRTMPLTRLVNAALDGVAGREAEVAADIVTYVGNDLLCYRADQPQGLVAQQAAHWDPLLDWASTEFGGRFATSTSVMHVVQEHHLIDALAARLERLGPLQLAALHVMTTLSGSALIAWAQSQGRIGAEAAWTAAHVDEDWQMAQWGEDAEAKARRQSRWLDFAAAARLHGMVG